MNEEKKFLKLLGEDAISYVNKYVAQIILLMINPVIYAIYAVGEGIYNIIYGGIYAISESAKRDTVRQETTQKKEEHLSNTVLLNIVYGSILCLIIICVRQMIGKIFFDDTTSINLLSVYFIFIIFKCFIISVLRPLYSVGNTEGNIVQIAKINKNRLTYVNIALVLLLIITKFVSINNVVTLMAILMIYILTEIHQVYLTHKIVGKLNIKYMKMKKSIKIFRENYHYLLSMIVYDFGSLLSTYVGSLFGVVGILISKVLYESYKFGSFIHNIYTKYLEEQIYTGKITEYAIVLKRTTFSAIIGSILSMIIFVLQLRFNIELKGFISLSIYSYIYIFVYCMSYCLDYSADIITRVSGNVKQLLIISIIDLAIKLLIVAIVNYADMDLFLSFALLLLGGFISYINVFRIIKNEKNIKIYSEEK